MLMWNVDAAVGGLRVKIRAVEVHTDTQAERASQCNLQMKDISLNMGILFFQTPQGK